MPICGGCQFQGSPHHPAMPGPDKLILHLASISSEERAPPPQLLGQDWVLSGILASVKILPVSV